MKAEQKFHLNRLAATLVTPQRFHPLYAGSLPAWEEAWNNAFAPARCPERNPNCEKPWMPAGFGAHANCLRVMAGVPVWILDEMDSHSPEDLLKISNMLATGREHIKRTRDEGRRLELATLPHYHVEWSGSDRATLDRWMARAYTPKPLTRWQRIKRTAEKFFHAIGESSANAGRMF